MEKKARPSPLKFKVEVKRLDRSIKKNDTLSEKDSSLEKSPDPISRASNFSFANLKLKSVDLSP